MKRILLISFLLVSSLFVHADYDWINFGRIPVLHEGRIKPLDTVARSTLLSIHGKSSIKKDGKEISASEWLGHLLLNPRSLEDVKTFRIDHPDVLGLLEKTSYEGPYFSFIEIEPYLEEMERLSGKALQKEQALRSPFEEALLNFRNQALLYWLTMSTVQLQDSLDFGKEVSFYDHLVREGKLRALAKEEEQALEALTDRYRFMAEAAQFYVVAADIPQEWQSLGESLIRLREGKKFSNVSKEWISLSTAYHGSNENKFNRNIKRVQEAIGEFLGPKKQMKLKLESFFNELAPFYWSMVFYVTAFVLILLSYIFWKNPLYYLSYGLLSITFLLHTAGLLLRMYIQGRPPVTSLYSSAIFIGWVVVLFSLLIEAKHKRGMFLVAASFMGFITQIIAHHLAQTGDSIEMMRAVLDSNFWLATHVVVITIGYASTYLAGLVANIYLIKRIFSKKWSEEETRKTALLALIITAFSTLAAFTGTVLGGIWADQSWGRFWGWDPKENGALLIVLWCALLLHLRVGKMVSQHGFLSLVALGTIITSLSWFGVNLLGIGLHSYGFMEGTFVYLLAFCLLQLLVVFIAFFVARLQKKNV